MVTVHIYTQSIILYETHSKAVIATPYIITITYAQLNLNLLEPPLTLKQIILFISALPMTFFLSMPYESLFFPRFQYIYFLKTMRWCIWTLYKCESKFNELWVLLLGLFGFKLATKIYLIFMLATIIVVFLTFVLGVNICTKI